jgi:hypothetical protein
MDIYKEAVEAGCTIDHYQSDLYLKKDAVSQKLVESYEFKQSVTTFISQIDRELWYDIPFAYSPYWEKLQKVKLSDLKTDHIK